MKISTHQEKNSITGWWAAQVASNKEYDTKREILELEIFDEDDVLIPRRMVYDVQESSVEMKTEKLLPGYILINFNKIKRKNSLEALGSYINLLGRVTYDEMINILSYENIPKDTNAEKGDKIIITKGPFAGVKGIIIRKDDTGYCKCRLVFQGNEIVVNMDNRIVEKIA